MATLPPLSPPPASSLYVGDLHPLIDNLQLSTLFAKYKSVSSVRVCRDNFTGRSLCYGYVNFLSPQEAIHAIETKNNTMYYGKMIRVGWCNRDPLARKSGIGNVFVKKLIKSIDNVQLQLLFKPFGNILSCKVATHENGKSKGYGYVQFESEQCANAAIEKLNGTDVGGKQIYVGKFIRKSDRILPNVDIKYTNIYFKNLESEMTEEVLENFFSKFGKIVSLVIARDESGISKEFGFVNFETPDDAKKAVEELNGSTLGSKVLYVARAQKKAEREHILHHRFEEIRKEQRMKYQGSNVYVKNIADDVTEDELKDYFSQCGTITSSKIMCNHKGLSKGFGFVCFTTPEEANKAINTLHGYIFHRKPLYVAIAQRKEDRQEQLQIHYANYLAGFVAPSSFIPGPYAPFYYTTLPGFPHQPRPAFQPSATSFASNVARPYRQNRGRMNMQQTQGVLGIHARKHHTHEQLTAEIENARHKIYVVRLPPATYIHG